MQWGSCNGSFMLSGCGPRFRVTFLEPSKIALQQTHKLDPTFMLMLWQHAGAQCARSGSEAGRMRRTNWVAFNGQNRCQTRSYFRF